jgi:hypothetical protein
MIKRTAYEIIATLGLWAVCVLSIGWMDATGIITTPQYPHGGNWTVAATTAANHPMAADSEIRYDAEDDI